MTRRKSENIMISTQTYNIFIIEKACEWLYQRQTVDLEVGDIDKFVNDFKKAMEGLIMAKYLYTNDYLHCSCERCPQHEKCWRFELWKMSEGKESYYLPDEREDLAKCEFYIDKEKYKIK